jgi:hypothetical protein
VGVGPKKENCSVRKTAHEDNGMRNGTRKQRRAKTRTRGTAGKTVPGKTASEGWHSKKRRRVRVGTRETAREGRHTKAVNTSVACESRREKDDTLQKRRDGRLQELSGECSATGVATM